MIVIENWRSDRYKGKVIYKMKILFVTSRLPFPPKGGDKLRVFNFIKLLSQKHEIYLLSFIESPEEKRHIEELKNFCKEAETILLKPIESYINCILYFFSKNPLQVSYYHSTRMHSKVKEFVERHKIDSICAHLIRMAPYAENLKIFKVLDLTDAISLSLKRSLKYRKHIFYLFYLLEWLKVRRYEKKMVQQFDKCILISDVEKNAIEGSKNLRNIEIVQNGVDFNKLTPSDKPYNDRKISFIGNLHSFPNRDAVLFFYSDILPLIKKDISDIEFHVVGINLPPKILKLKEDRNIVVKGSVEDLKHYLEDSACFVCPIRSGAGLQNKILEAMSLGLPVVTTSIGFEGIKAEKGRDLLIADNPDDFAKRVIEIIKDKNLRNNLSQNARKLVLEKYNWQDIIRELENIFEKGRSNA